METKTWWRCVDSLYDIIAQCARKVDTERLEHIELRTNDYSNTDEGSHIYVRASSRGFLNGKYDALRMDVHVPKIAEGQIKFILEQVVDTGKGYNLCFNAEKFQEHELKRFKIGIIKGSALENFFAPTVLYNMRAEGPVSAEDLALYKNLALNLGAIAKPQNETAELFEISEKTGRAYAAKRIGINRKWDPIAAYKLASENNFDVSLSSERKGKYMHASFARFCEMDFIDLHAGITSKNNPVCGPDMNEAESLFRLFNSVREFGGREWTVEYRMKPEPVKLKKEPEKPKNIIMTTEMQREEFLDKVILELGELKKK